MFLIDTCILSEFAKSADHQSKNLRTWIQSVDFNEVRVPVSAILEIECGIQRLLSVNPIKAKALGDWLDKLLASGLRVQPITTDISRLYARMASTPALKHLWLTPPKKGIQTPAQDLMIAATAICLEATLFTVNLRDFRMIDSFFRLPALISPDDLPFAREATIPIDGVCHDRTVLVSQR